MARAAHSELMSAINKKHSRKIINLIQKRHISGLDINSRNVDGYTPLIRAADAGNTDIVKLLLNCDEIKVSLVEIKGDWEGDQAIHKSALFGRTEVIKLFLEKGADVNARGAWGRTPLMRAALTGETTCAELLLDRGARVDDQNNAGETALIWAAYNNHSSCIQLLLDRGADINVKDKQCETALYKATEKGHVSSVKLLLRRGAEVEWEGQNSPLHAARHMGMADVVKLLEDHKKQMDLSDEMENWQKPEIDGLEHKQVQIGETATFEVTVTGKPEPEIQWSHQGRDVTTGVKYEIQQQGGNGSLVIRNCDVKDQGQISVQAKNPTHSINSLVRLIVKENPCQQIQSSRTVHVYDVAQRFILSLRLSDAYYESKFDVCFCEYCHAIKRDELVYLRGNPPRKYGLPIGWFKFGLKTKPQAKADRVFENWHVAFHGTRVDCVAKIIEAGDLLLPGDTTPDGYRLRIPDNHWDPKHPDPKMRPPPGHDVKKFYFSPSIKYSGCEVYAPIHRWTDEQTGQQHKIRVALQARIRPGSYQVSYQTIGSKQTIDPLFPNAELEWSTSRRSVAILVGLLVKVENLVGDQQLKESDLPDIPGVQKRSDGDFKFRAVFKRDYIHENNDGKEITLKAGDKCWVIHQKDKICHAVHNDVNEPIVLAANFLRKV